MVVPIDKQPVWRVSAADRLHVLFVEDNEGDVDLIRELLADHTAAIQMDHVDTLAASLTCLASRKVDVVLLDLSLPDAAGLTALERMHAAVPDVPIVVLTSIQDESLGARAVQAGAQDYLVKGQSSAWTLLRAMRYAVERQHAARAAVEEAQAAVVAHRLRMSFLADATLRLSGTMNGALLEKRLREVAALAVPRFADCCIIERGATSARPALLALKHVAPEKEALVTALYHSGATELPGDEDPPRGDGRDSAPPPPFGALGVCARAGAPIGPANEHTGRITFLYTVESQRQFVPEDRSMIRHLAQTAHIASENVRLHEEMSRAVQLREDFVANASHELRTPLGALILHLGRLKDGLDALPADGSKGVIATWVVVERQVARLELLVGTLLDVARSGSLHVGLEREDVDLVALVGGMIERFAVQASKAGSVFEFDTSHSVVGSWDRMRVEQIVTNLLSNTIKYGAGEPVALTVLAKNGDGVLSVRDGGIGIAASDATRIFERFERGAAVTKSGGLGLGLHIARALAMAHGGSLEVISELGKGSTFVLTLPLVPPAPTMVFA